MPTGLNENKALLVCPQGRGADKLKPLLAGACLREAEVVSSGSEARRAIAELGIGVVVINAPLPDESGMELATELCQGSTLAVILLVKAELMGMIYTPATEAGVLVVPKPLNPALFTQALQLGTAMQNRLKMQGQEYEKLQYKLEEIRAVDRAKCLLIQHMHISEEEAHRAIEKQAMDMRLPKMRVARELIRKFEL